MSSPEAIYPLPSGDPSVATQCIAAIWTLVSTSTVFLMIRLYCRTVRSKQIWWDDYFLIIGWVFLMTSVGLQNTLFHEGYLVTALGGERLTPINLASDSAMKMALLFSKTSFVFTLLRFAEGWMKWVVIVTAIFMDASCLVHAVLVWKANCGSVRSFHILPCWPANSGIYMNMVGSVISAISDVILALIPIKIIWGLQMIKREKIGVAIAMSLGILAGIVAVIKAVESYETANVVGTEFSYRLAKLSILIHAEPNAAIIAASIPVLRVFFNDVKDHYSGSHQRQYIKSNQLSSFHGNMGTNISTVRAESHDNDSETSILQGEQNKYGITRTRQITVNHENNNPKVNEQEDGIEMSDRPPKSVGQVL